MKDETWLEAFVHELEAAGVGPEDRAGAVVETEGFLSEAGSGAFEQFGSPQEYAAAVATALGQSGRRADPPPGGGDAVVVSGVSKSYRRQVVLREVSVRVGSGEVVVLTGPNGAGKSTLLRLIAGLERPDAGSIDVHGTVGYVPQAGGLDPYLRAQAHFELFGAATGLDRDEARREGNRLARELGWDAGSATVAGELSGGTAQKLSVIAAMLGRPDTLLLDEPYEGMDADSQRRFWALLWAWQDEGRSALVSSHSPDALAKATSVVEIEGLTVR